jgi:tRNA modification GTPase
MHEPDTIAAISTPPGRGGIGIVRLSGPHAFTIAAQLVATSAPFEHARVRFGKLLDSTGAVLDEALITAFHAPHSYTGEDIAEIAAHGSPVILEATLRAAIAAGERLGLPVRLAQPGEFTQRAFLAGRLDLTQAEAVHDLIAAQTLDQARVAAQQLGGALARQVAPAKGSLLHLIALLEAGMDFASGELDDVDVVPPSAIASAIADTQAPLQALADTFRRGRLLRDGAAIALIGPPNAGKSSLFNRLLARDRAIVTAIPGTTRDTLEETLSLNGIPIRLIDTAGLHAAAADEAESQGIARTHEALADADLILLLHDITQPLTPAEQSLAASLNDRPHLLIHNKLDLLGANPTAELSPRPAPATPIQTSALTGHGLDQLRSAILDALNAGGSLADTALLNNLRQQQAIADTLTALGAANDANLNHLPHELILLDLHTALRHLDSLTGTTTPDDILARIFSTFCIGK